MKLSPVVVRDRFKGLQKLPWKMIGPTFGSVRFEHGDLGTVVLIARTFDRPGTRCTFTGSAVFDRPAVTVEASAAAVYAAFRAAAGDVMAATGGTVVATLPADAIKTAADVVKVCQKDGRYTGLRIEAGTLTGSDGKTLFVAEVPTVTATGAYTLPLDALRSFVDGDVRSDGGKLAAGAWSGEQPNDGRYPEFRSLLSAPVESVDWIAEVDGAAFLSALKTADSDAVTLAVVGGTVTMQGAESYSVLPARGRGDVTTTVRIAVARTIDALKFLGVKGPVRVQTHKGPKFVRIEGSALDRCCIMSEVVPIKVKA